jgi:para-nitrobenzyl esterase
MRVLTSVFLSAVAATSTVAVVPPAGAPTVTLSVGDVYGRPLPASGGVPVNEFLGIPFGQPTIRWEPPVDYTDKLPESPFNATMWGRACLQVLTDTTSYGSEDCLHINVWQPANNATATATAATATSTAADVAGADDEDNDLKPVLVFVYGGGNQYGEAEPYNMSGLAAFHDVVAVNFNYRTGPIGWMAFEDDVQQNKSTGNFGILDIQSALRWVQREIKAFGGDPTRVAIHGQSSGAGLTEVGCGGL